MRFYRQLESAFVQNALLPANTSYAKKHHTQLYMGIYSYIDNIYARKLWASRLYSLISRGYYLIVHQHKLPKYFRCILIYESHF